jgi:Domain of unknown function (DUF4398)
MNLRFPALTAAFLCCAACASSGPTPNPKAESSSSAIRAAEEVGATHTPDAALHLQLAKEEFEYAQRIRHPDEKDHADRLLRRAQADAELALALARSESEKAEALAAIDKVTKLNASVPQ